MQDSLELSVADASVPGRHTPAAKACREASVVVSEVFLKVQGGRLIRYVVEFEAVGAEVSTILETDVDTGVGETAIGLFRLQFQLDRSK